MQKYLEQSNVDIFVSLYWNWSRHATNHSLYRGPIFIAMNFDTLIYLTWQLYDLLRFWLPVNLVSGFLLFFFPCFFVLKSMMITSLVEHNNFTTKEYCRPAVHSSQQSSGPAAQSWFYPVFFNQVGKSTRMDTCALGLCMPNRRMWVWIYLPFDYLNACFCLYSLFIYLFMRGA